MEVSEISRDATRQMFNLNEGSREGHVRVTSFSLQCLSCIILSDPRGERVCLLLASNLFFANPEDRTSAQQSKLFLVDPLLCPDCLNNHGSPSAKAGSAKEKALLVQAQLW
jgi:hypothetical protein